MIDDEQDAGKGEGGGCMGNMSYAKEEISKDSKEHETKRATDRARRCSAGPTYFSRLTYMV
jgi:hypothetical protein